MSATGAMLDGAVAVGTLTNMFQNNGKLAGIVGNLQYGAVRRAANHMSVTSSDNRVGALAGYASQGISDSYNDAAMRGSEWVGGLVGESAAPTLTRVFNVGQVTATMGAKGPLLGNGSATLVNAFYDNQTVGMTTGSGTGKSTAEMKTASTFAGWPADWVVVDGGYPHLAIEDEVWGPCP